ncbi:MAG: ffh [Rickettsiaceae bacterium]|jgi:signal recognition particle subunit SRP54|nr:ffh [Rickettsiaceae bacterium]
MFKSLTNNLIKVFDKLRSKGVLTEADLDDAMREIRLALLEADVAVSVVKDFIAGVKEKALGQEVVKSISPGQMIVKIVNDELVKVLDSPPEERKLKLNKRPSNILMVGLQGSGKTTLSAKLALKLSSQGKKVLLASLDVYRPAAQTQLEVLAKSIEVVSLSIIEGQKPIEIAKRALAQAKNDNIDVVIFDTAGRLHIDTELMQELQSLKQLIDPQETLLVVDALIGQDAVNVAREFNEAVEITGIALTRVDADSRGGAALSLKQVTSKPIKFLGVGEKVQALEEFDASRIASRILDMGDVVSIVEQAQKLVDEDEAAKLEKKIMKGSLSLSDYLTQLRMIKKIGSSGILSMLPGAAKFGDALTGNMDKAQSLFKKQEAIILSMTKQERRYPALLNASRKKRIAAGSGTEVSDINKMLKDFEKINNMVKKVAKLKKSGGMMSNIKQLFS